MRSAASRAVTGQSRPLPLQDHDLLGARYLREERLNIIDAFTVPNLHYDADRGKFLLFPSLSVFILGPTVERWDFEAHAGWETRPAISPRLRSVQVPSPPESLLTRLPSETRPPIVFFDE